MLLFTKANDPHFWLQIMIEICQPRNWKLINIYLFDNTSIIHGKQTRWKIKTRLFEQIF